MKKEKVLIDFTPKWQKILKRNISALKGSIVLYQVKYENETLLFNLEISKNTQGVFFYLQRTWKEFTSQRVKYSKYDVDDEVSVNSSQKTDVRSWFVSFDFYNNFIGVVEDSYKQIAAQLSAKYEPSMQETYKNALYNYLVLHSNDYYKQFLTYKLISDIFINKSFDQYYDAVISILEKEKNKIDSNQAIVEFYQLEQEIFINQISNQTKFLSKIIIEVEDEQNQTREDVIKDEFPGVVAKFNLYKDFKINDINDIKEYLKLYNELKDEINSLNQKQEEK